MTSFLFCVGYEMRFLFFKGIDLFGGCEENVCPPIHIKAESAEMMFKGNDERCFSCLGPELKLDQKTESLTVVCLRFYGSAKIYLFKENSGSSIIIYSPLVFRL